MRRHAAHGLLQLRLATSHAGRSMTPAMAAGLTNRRWGFAELTGDFARIGSKCGPASGELREQSGKTTLFQTSPRRGGAHFACNGASGVGHLPVLAREAAFVPP